MQKIKCGGCSHLFSLREAKCIDWRDPKKSCICPKCDKALQPVDVKKAVNFKQIAIQAGMTGFFMAFFGALTRNFSGNTLYALMGGTLVIVFGVALYFREPEQPIVRPPFDS